MKLPNGNRSRIGSKLTDYVLNRHHPTGKHKARVFEARLGITVDSALMLQDLLTDAAANSSEFEARGDDGHGELYVLRLPIQTATGDAQILSAWIVRHGEAFPRLTTCYIL